LVGAIGEFAQDARFGFLSDKWTVNLPTWFGVFIATRNTKENERIERIRIFPGSITLHQGQQAVFAAIAYDEQNDQLSGVDFKWKTRDEGRGRDLRLMNNSVFKAHVLGTFSVTAKAKGREAQATVTVIPNPFASAQAKKNES